MSERMEKRGATLIVHGWSTECGECGYGKGGWQNSPALEGKPTLGPESEICPGCGCQFTETEDAAPRNLTVAEMLLHDD